VIRPVESWAEVPGCINARPALAEYELYGISRSLCANELWVDFGEGWTGTKVAMAKIKFVTDKDASAAYCRGIKMTIKVTEQPDLEERLPGGKPNPVLEFRRNNSPSKDYPDYPREDWLHDVTHCYVDLGYWEWVAYKLDIDHGV
jgi:hypothetical protein